MRPPLIITWRLISTIALFIFAIIPGSLATPFDGLPFNTLETLIFFGVLIVIWAIPARPNSLLKKIWFISLTALIIWQGLGAILIPQGWGVCLQRELEKETLTTPCEPSAQFNTGDPYTFTINHIAWEEKNYPLYFMNEAPFSYTNELEPERSTMPYTFTATAYFKPSHDTQLIATTNTPHTFLQVNEQTSEVPFDEELVLDLPAHQTTGIRLNYTAPHADSNSIAISTSARPFHQPPSNFAGPLFIRIYQIIFYLIAAALFYPLLVIFISHFKALPRPLQQTSIISLLILLGAYLTENLTASLFIVAALILILLHVFSKSSRQLLPFTLFGLICLAIIYANAFRPLDVMHLMGGGGDQITHTTHARSLLKATHFKDFLIAGEGHAFYYQAFYRYFLATTHKVLGEAIWAPTVTQTFLLLLAIWYGAKTLRRLAGPIPASFFALTIYLGIALFDSHPLKLATTSYQEALGLPLFLITVLFTINAWAFKKPTYKTLFYVSLLWGLTISTRNNLLPAAGMLIIFALASIIPARPHLLRLKQIMAMISGFIIFPILIIIRNLIVDGQARFLTTSLHPNLIDPFRPLFPHIGGASDLTFAQALSTILSAYHGRKSELFDILWLNLRTHYIGLTALEEKMWIILLLLAAYLLILKPLTTKISTLMILAFALTPMAFGAFFLHREIAAQSQSHLVLAVSLSLLLALLILPKKSNPATTPPPPS